MCEFGVNRNSDQLAVNIIEFLDFVIEGNNLSWTDKGEVQRVKEQNHILLFVRLKVNINEIFLEPGRSHEVRSRLSNQ